MSYSLILSLPFFSFLINIFFGVHELMKYFSICVSGVWNLRILVSSLFYSSVFFLSQDKVLKKLDSAKKVVLRSELQKIQGWGAAGKGSPGQLRDETVGRRGALKDVSRTEKRVSCSQDRSTHLDHPSPAKFADFPEGGYLLMETFDQCSISLGMFKSKP